MMRRLVLSLLDGVVITCLLALTVAAYALILVSIGFFVATGALWAIRAAA